jgi:uncharacterized protein involved in exopolysaccharide biosynthesis
MTHSHQNAAANDSMGALSLRDALSPIFRHRRLVIAVFAGVFICSVLVAWFWVSKYYVAKMQVLVEQTRSDPTISAGQDAAVVTNRAPSSDVVSSEIALLQGQDMMRQVAQTCGFAERSSWMSDIFLPRDPERRRAVKLEKAALSVGKAVKAEAEKGSAVINVKFGSIGSPETPACVLQNLGKLYLAKRLLLRRPVGTSTFFAEQAEKYNHDLGEVENKLANFGHDQGVAAPDAMRPFLAQQVAVSGAALHTAQQGIAADEARLAGLEKQLRETPERIVTQQTTNAANSLLQNLEASLLESQVKRTQLLAKFNDSYPLVREADEEIAQTQAAIAQAKQMIYKNETTDRDPTREFLRQDYARTQADLASQKATAVATANSLKSLRLQMDDLEMKTIKQGALLRQAKADETNYLLYLTKREQERTSDALDERSIADVAVAVPPVVPALPAINPFTFGMLGFLFALIAGASSAFIVEYIDSSFRSPEEVTNILKIPVLASVPRRAA